MSSAVKAITGGLSLRKNLNSMEKNLTKITCKERKWIFGFQLHFKACFSKASNAFPKISFKKNFISFSALKEPKILGAKNYLSIFLKTLQLDWHYTKLIEEFLLKKQGLLDRLN
ncbi:hypothetical protein BpHYR1_038652 [Brachionus plicatilis]|uniref:Uncharacterized protein n=1 Tax=Brachionus plicatilis TaxID=10195 RepID=A0A3M7RKC1_BRAPC|nr:hypothetical protein BpHYR1_038652 [Brachionus plicatilis]